MGQSDSCGRSVYTKLRHVAPYFPTYIPAFLSPSSHRPHTHKSDEGGSPSHEQSYLQRFVLCIIANDGLDVI